MKKRSPYLILLTLSLLFIFILQKPIFMICNMEVDSNLSFLDYCNVILNGLPLDLAITSYLVIIPVIILFISIWVSKINLRKILVPYYVIIALLISIIFISQLRPG